MRDRLMHQCTNAVPARLTQCLSSGQPNKPMVPTVPAPLAELARRSWRRHTGEPLGSHRAERVAGWERANGGPRAARHDQRSTNCVRRTAGDVMMSSKRQTRRTSSTKRRGNMPTAFRWRPTLKSVNNEQEVDSGECIEAGSGRRWSRVLGPRYFPGCPRSQRSSRVHQPRQLQLLRRRSTERPLCEPWHRRRGEGDVRRRPLAEESLGR